MKTLYRFLALVIWIVLCLLLFHLFYQEAKENAIAELNARQMLHARQAAKGIEGFVDHWINMLTRAAAQKSLIDLNEEGKRQMAFLLGDREQGIRGISRVDAQGRIIYTLPLDAKAIGADISGQKHVQEVIRTQRPVLSGVFTTVQGYPAVALHVPVFEGKAFRGSLGIFIDFALLSKNFLEDISIGKSGYAWMMDREGVELYCPVPGHTGHSVFENCRNDPTILAMAREMVQGRQGITTYLYDQVRGQTVERTMKHAVYLPIRIADSYWSIVVATSEEDVVASLAGFRNRLLILLSILLLGSLAFSFSAIKSWALFREEEKRRKTEKELHESEARFRRAVQGAEAGYFLLDVEGCYRDVNDAWLHLHKYTSRDEVIGRHYSFTQIDSDGEEAGRITNTILEGRTVRAGEFTRRCKDGSVGYHTFSANPVLRDGKVVGVEGFIIDTTEQRQVEERLRESQSRFQSLFMSMNEGMALHELCLDGEGRPVDYRILDVNRAFEKILGIPREKALGQRGSALYGIDPAPYLDHYAKVALTGQPDHFETFFAPLGKTFLISLFSPAKSQFATVFEDVTEKKMAELELRRSEERYRELYDEAPVGYHEIDAEGRIVQVNRRELQLLGYTAEEMQGRPIWAFVVEPEVEERVRAILAGQMTQDRAHDRTYRCKDGSTIPVQVYSQVIRDQEGRIIGTRATIQDITERKRAEEEKGKLQAQLLQAQKMESVGRLAGGVAHDFNNMLGIIIGHAELAALRVEPDSPVHKGLEEILKASHRSADMVRQLLAFARKQTISPKVLDLNDTVQGMLRMLQRLIGEDIALHWIPGKGLWPVRMDATQLHQILVNLLLNGRDAIDGIGSITLETGNVVFDEAYCRQHEGAVPGQYVRLAVTDTGSGMGPEVIAQLFDPFFTTKEVGKGTGLGLATVYGIVKQNNGFINVYSERGQGSTFKIYIPCHGNGQAAPETVTTESPLGGMETILIVEDEETLLGISRVSLERMGYRVLTARSPREALAVAAGFSGEIHLLLTDVVMPEMNGRELMERLQPLRPAMKSLFMSGYTANVIVHRGVLDEGVFFLQKPFSSHDLARKVREVLDRPGGAGHSPGFNFNKSDADK